MVPASGPLETGDRRARLLALVAELSIRAHLEASEGWVALPEIDRRARRVRCRPTRTVLRCDLRWLVEAGQLEVRREPAPAGCPWWSQLVWYRLRPVGGAA